MNEQQYPISFSVDYPDRTLNRLTTFFRIIVIIPIAFVLATISGGSSAGYGEETAGATAAAGGGIVFIAPLLLILFRRKYPRWWFDWNLELTRFSNRVGAYFALLDDRYPSTDEEQAIHLQIAYPDAQRDLNRWLPLVKWLLAIPHYIVLIFLYIAAIIVVIIAWFAILITGRYPRGLFDFVQGVFRWTNRVTGYAFILATDRYPPFRLSP
jgi:hypothetical protein